MLDCRRSIGGRGACEVVARRLQQRRSSTCSCWPEPAADAGHVHHTWQRVYRIRYDAQSSWWRTGSAPRALRPRPLLVESLEIAERGPSEPTLVLLTDDCALTTSVPPELAIGVPRARSEFAAASAVHRKQCSRRTHPPLNVRKRRACDPRREPEEYAGGVARLGLDGQMAEWLRCAPAQHATGHDSSRRRREQFARQHNRVCNSYMMAYTEVCRNRRATTLSCSVHT